MNVPVKSLACWAVRVLTYVAWSALLRTWDELKTVLVAKSITTPSMSQTTASKGLPVEVQTRVVGVGNDKSVMTRGSGKGREEARHITISTNCQVRNEVLTLRNA